MFENECKLIDCQELFSLIVVFTDTINTKWSEHCLSGSANEQQILSKTQVNFNSGVFGSFCSLNSLGSEFIILITANM